MSHLLWLLMLGAPAASAAPPADAVVVEAVSAREVDVQTLAKDLEAKKVSVLIDVRTPDEFATGHVPGAKNIPVDEVSARIGEFQAHGDAEIYLVCRSGARSARAAGLLQKAGVKTVNVAGGTLAWQKAGNPTE